MKVLLEAMLHRRRERRPKLSDIVECVENPDGAAFISQEIERQGSEKRSYTIISVMDDGSSFFADLSGDDVRPGREFTIVRKVAPISVPSYQRPIGPVKWIAEAVLKHVHQNVGHFKVLGKRWEANRLGGGLAALTGSGNWVEYEKFTDTVRANDLVLKE
jgi:hypothetical protein